MEVHQSTAEPWRVTLVDTGDETMTGGRLARVLDYVARRATFCLTYGDGVADIDITRAGRVPPRAGHAGDGHRRAAARALRRAARSTATACTGFAEKPQGDGGWINGGFFVLSPEVGALPRGRRRPIWEREPLEGLARDGQLAAYQHDGLLAADGHAARQRQLQALWDSARRRGRSVAVDARVLARPARPGHRPHRLQGRLAAPVARRRWAPR